MLKNDFGGLSDVVAHHGGVVEDVIGDSLVALFGLRLGAADDAERAAACALAMQIERDEINDRGARVQLPALEIGVGVASGDVAVVTLETGDPVNYKAVGVPPLGELANVDREHELPATAGAGDAPTRAHRLLGLGGSRLISLRSVPSD